MSNTYGTEKDHGDAIRKFWNTCSGIYRKRGLDLGKLLAEFAVRETQKLRSPGARNDFDELSRNGCAPEVLAAILSLFWFGPHLKGFWAFAVGTPYKRQKGSQQLEKAARLVERVLASVIVEETETMRIELGRLGHILPSQIVSEIRLHGQLLTIVERLAAETEARSIEDFATLLLTAYVKRATGSFNDRTVSGIVGEVCSRDKYFEVTHRMWRHRSKLRLSKYSQIADMLFHLGVVVFGSLT